MLKKVRIFLKLGFFLGIKYEPLLDPPVIKICEWGPWDSPFCIPQEMLKAKFMQQYWEGADRQSVLGNAKITNTCVYINVT